MIKTHTVMIVLASMVQAPGMVSSLTSTILGMYLDVEQLTAMVAGFSVRDTSPPHSCVKRIL